MTSDQLPHLLTVEHAGKLLGLGRSSAYRAARRGDLPTLRFGTRVLVPTVRLLELVGVRVDATPDGVRIVDAAFRRGV